jgi:hypothetical protein
VWKLLIFFNPSSSYAPHLKPGWYVMKRYIRAVVLLSVTMCWTVFAEAASLSIFPDPLVGLPGETLPTSIVYTAEGAQIAALQFDVLYSPGDLNFLDADAGSAAILASKELFFDTGSTGDNTFLIVGPNQNIIGDGSVANLTFVGFNAPAGSYNLSLSGILGADANGDPVTITNLNPIAAVPEPSTWLLLGAGLVGLAAWRWKQAA